MIQGGKENKKYRRKVQRRKKTEIEKKKEERIIFPRLGGRVCTFQPWIRNAGRDTLVKTGE